MKNKTRDSLVSALAYVNDAVYNQDNTERARNRAQELANDISEIIREVEAEEHFLAARVKAQIALLLEQECGG